MESARLHRERTFQLALATAVARNAATACAMLPRARTLTPARQTAKFLAETDFALPIPESRAQPAHPTVELAMQCVAT